MAHHGIAKNPRLNRLMQKKYRSESQHKKDAETVIHRPNEKKRQASQTPQEDLTKVVATVVSVIDNESQTTSSESTEMTLSMSWSGDASGQITISAVSADPSSIPVSVPSNSADGSITASPAYSSPMANIPSLTSKSLISNSSSTPTPAHSSSHLIPSSILPFSTSTAFSSSTTISGTTQILSTSSNSSTFYWIGSDSTSTPSSTFLSSSFTDTSSVTTSGGGGGGGGAVATGDNSSSTDSPDSSQNSTSASSANTGTIIGGVVGGCAGAFFLFLIAFLLLRHKKASMRKAQDALPSSNISGGTGGEGSIARSGEMTSRRSSNVPLFRASYFSPAFMRRWRQSTQTTCTDSTLASSTSERGFQKISGRKIPSVLRSGGDGYGGGLEEGSPTTSEPSMSLPPSSPSFTRSPVSQPPPSTPYGMPLDVSYTRETDESGPVVIVRPSPARTPVNVTSSNASIASRAHQQGTLSPTIPQRPDVLGRSHPSFDGSRGSRFTESL